MRPNPSLERTCRCPPLSSNVGRATHTRFATKHRRLQWSRYRFSLRSRNFVKRAIELLKIGEKRVDRRFEQFWRPIYVNLQDVHRDYLRMFAEVEDILSRSPSAGDGDLDPYSAAVRCIRTNRLALAPVRDELTALEALRTNRAHVSKLTQPELDFLHCLVRYIRPISLPDGATSRSAGLQHELHKADAEREALEELSVTQSLDRMRMPEKVERLSDDWRLAAAAFQALQLSVINRST